MPVRKRKPTSPGRRFQTVSDVAELTTDRPEKSLLAKKSKTAASVPTATRMIPR